MKKLSPCPSLFFIPVRKVMKKKELLRPYDQALAEQGHEICWSCLDTPVKYVGVFADDRIIVDTHGYNKLESASHHSLRMKPLFWFKDMPIYGGDKLWHTLVRKMVTVGSLQSDPKAEENGWFVTPSGIRYSAGCCELEEPSLTPQPLFMLEGKPVYSGTRVWHVNEKEFITISHSLNNGDYADDKGIGRSPCYMRWVGKKKHVMYANLYNDNNHCSGYSLGMPYENKEDAKHNGSSNTLGVARIEWETDVSA